jgi:hypothetical protein
MKPVRFAIVIAVVSAAIGLTACNKPAIGQSTGPTSDIGAPLKG